MAPKCTPTRWSAPLPIPPHPCQLSLLAQITHPRCYCVSARLHHSLVWAMHHDGGRGVSADARCGSFGATASSLGTPLPVGKGEICSLHEGTEGG